MQPGSGGGFRLIVRRGPQPNQVYDLNKDVQQIGRDITNDITINDPEVSRHHAKLTRGGGGFTMEDLGSTNGTFVNGQRLMGARPLNPGDMIGLGETVTLAYESTAMAGAGYMPPQQPMGAPMPSQPQGGYAPSSPYAPPSPGMQAPPPPQPQQAYPPQYQPYPATQQPMYDYGDSQPSGSYVYENEPQSGGMARWLLLGCGCFIVLCVIGAVVGLILIDQTCAWDQEPINSIIEIFGFTADETFKACQ